MKRTSKGKQHRLLGVTKCKLFIECRFWEFATFLALLVEVPCILLVLTKDEMTILISQFNQSKMAKWQKMEKSYKMTTNITIRPNLKQNIAFFCQIRCCTTAQTKSWMSKCLGYMIFLKNYYYLLLWEVHFSIQ